MIVLHSPKKKTKNYVSKISIDNKNLSIKIPFAQFIHLQDFEGGKLLKCWLPKESSAVEKLTEIDLQVLKSVIENNTLWFKNNLDSSKINTFFRNSFNEHRNTITVLLSKYKEPNIYLNNKEIDIDSAELNALNLKDKQLYIELESNGLYFYPQKFGIRWLVKNLYITTNNDTSNEDLINKTDIETYWKEDLDELENNIEKECIELHNKIE